MALPGGSDLKTYLRIENDAEDSLLDELVESATADAESLINRPILATQRDYPSLRALNDEYDRSVVYLPEYPVALSPALAITDKNGDTVDEGDYLVDASGRITASSSAFALHPYSVRATVGLELAENFTTYYEPLIRKLIIGLAAIEYKQRNPNATSDSSGAGVSVSYAMNEETEGLPPHLYRVVRKLRPVRIR